MSPVMRLTAFAVALSTLTAGISLFATPAARACGCFHPPQPPDTVTDFAVNQQSEQILFEVNGDGTITAHVLITYAGDPAEFAWVVPVPSVPDLELSNTLYFPMLDATTRPEVTVSAQSRCPSQKYRCEFNPPCDPFDVAVDAGSFQDSAPSGDASSGGGTPPGAVNVIKSEVIGDYETIVFSATDAGLAIQWLIDNGFIVNDTMTPYMQPYLDAGMLIIAAKLVPGAGVDSIRPLRMTYTHPRPIIPLRLTAVAADPHLTVTSWILADEVYRPMGHPLVDPYSLIISEDLQGRSNYPMALARAIDDAGGDGFIAEYAGAIPPAIPIDDPSGCCTGGVVDGASAGDACGVANDGLCQCPGFALDADDCDADLTAAAEALDTLTAGYTTLTRLTTRVSPEDMTFDPQFEPATGNPVGVNGQLVLSGTRYHLDECGSDIIDPDAYALINDRQTCASVYCGQGECAAGIDGAGCICDPGYVAKIFNDLDGLRSVTCVPQAHTVDLGLNLTLPDPCVAGVVGAGSCVDVGGFPAASCDAGQVAVVPPTGVLPVCSPVTVATGSPGGENFSLPVQVLEVCNPKPPVCGPGGWLVERPQSISGVDCAANAPTPEQLEVKPNPCGEDVAGPEQGPEPQPEPYVPDMGPSEDAGPVVDAGPSDDTGSTVSDGATAADAVADVTTTPGGGTDDEGCSAGRRSSPPWALVLLAALGLLLWRRRG